MNDHTQQPDQQPDDAYRPQPHADDPIEMPAHERDAMISRIVDGCAGGEDWDTFRALATEDPEIWSDLAVAQHQFETLSEIVHGSSAIADSVELPGGAIRHDHHQHRFDLVSRWGGWAAAAAILLVWVTGMNTQKSQMNLPSQTAGLLTTATPDQAMEQYVTAGQQAGSVVGEMPNPVVVETRPMPDGTFEVLYLRQILERKILSEIYRDVSDEHGNTIAVPVKNDPSQIRSF
jgi:hypothetical protein